MRELYDFRLFESEAQKYAFEEGELLSAGLTRRVRATPRDPVFQQLRTAHAEVRKAKRYLISGWSCTRLYTAAELNAAAWFLGIPTKWFDPETDGTEFDDSVACPICGFGARQISPLRLPIGSIPNGADLASSIAGHLVVSERFKGLVDDAQLTGAEFTHVEPAGPRRLGTKSWFQLVPTTCAVEVVSPTTFGIDPFGLDERSVDYVCPKGHVLGLNRTSELTVDVGSLEAVDIQATRAAVGHRLGVLRPERMLIFSKQFYEMFKRENLKGLRFEIVRTGGEAAET